MITYVTYGCTGLNLEGASLGDFEQVIPECLRLSFQKAWRDGGFAWVRKMRDEREARLFVDWEVCITQGGASVNFDIQCTYTTKRGLPTTEAKRLTEKILMYTALSSLDGYTVGILHKWEKGQ